MASRVDGAGVHMRRDLTHNVGRLTSLEDEGAPALFHLRAQSLEAVMKPPALRSTDSEGAWRLVIKDIERRERAGAGGRCDRRLIVQSQILP